MEKKGQEMERKKKEGKMKRKRKKILIFGLSPPKPKWHQNVKARLL